MNDIQILPEMECGRLQPIRKDVDIHACSMSIPGVIL